MTNQDAAQLWAQEQLDREFNGQPMPVAELARRVIGCAMIFAAVAKEAQLDDEAAVELVRSYLDRVTVLRKKPVDV